VKKIGKWSISLVEFHLDYIPQKTVKGQALVDFLADHPCADITKINEALFLEVVLWKFHFDGSRTKQGVGIGVILESPLGVKTHVPFKLDKQCSNNQLEYEALIFGLELLLEMKAHNLEVYGDS
jgi:hypothetical protein